ncbi:MAG: hypothetical protein RLN90_02455 [Balneolaceae bacterium]
MKDYSQYTYPELYDMLNHINPFKYQDKIESVRKEIELRKKIGEVPEQLVPETDWEPLKFWKKEKDENV